MGPRATTLHRTLSKTQQDKETYSSLSHVFSCPWFGAMAIGES
jgi:hypothetical protein